MNKKRVSKFGKLVKKARISQTDLKNKLEDEGVHKALMTVHRWCTGDCDCRDLYVCKAIAKVLDIPVEKIVEAFDN